MPVIPAANRVVETTTSQGLGDVQLAGAVPGWQGFDDAFGANASGLRVAIVHLTRDVDGNVTGGDWEVGIYDYDHASRILLRSSGTVLESSTGTTVNFGAGEKTVFLTYPASEAMSKAENLAGLSSASDARANLGATGVGDAVFIAATAAAARSALGSGATGDSLFASDTAATARGHLALGDAALRTVGTASTANLLDRAQLDARFAALGHDHAGVYAPATHHHDQVALTVGQSGGTVGRVVRQSSSNTWANAANTDTTAQLGTVSFLHASGIYVLEGVVTYTGAAAGTNYYLSTAGQITSMPPTPSASVRLLYVGKGIATNSLMFRPAVPIGG